MMHSIRKNVLAVVLVIAMLFSLCGSAIAAAEPESAGDHRGHGPECLSDGEYVPD